ncbi:MAG: hypothetical protein ACREPQ_14570 [Rhodanobacter sp.]
MELATSERQWVASLSGEAIAAVVTPREIETALGRARSRFPNNSEVEIYLGIAIIQDMLSEATDLTRGFTA